MHSSRTGARSLTRTSFFVAPLMLVAAGCAVTSDAERVLDATARAENRIGKSGESALSATAALASSASCASDRAAEFLASLGAVGSDARAEIAGVASGARSTLYEARDALRGARGALAAVGSETTATMASGRRALDETGGLIRELRGIAADARGDVESGGLTRKLLIALVTLVALVLVHAVIAHVHLHRHITRHSKRGGSDAPTPRP